jgi:hypothetical protein
MFTTVTILLISAILLFTPPVKEGDDKSMGLNAFVVRLFRIGWTAVLLIIIADALHTSSGQPEVPETAYALIDLVFMFMVIFRYNYVR